MTYKTIDAVNTTQGIHTLFVYVNDITAGLFTRLFLLSMFIIMGMGAYLSQKRLNGRSDLPGSLAIAGFVTSGAAIIMSFIPGLIYSLDIVVVFSVTILCVFWLFMSDKSE